VKIEGLEDDDDFSDEMEDSIEKKDDQNEDNSNSAMKIDE
jgi:hypothetical protein